MARRLVPPLGAVPRDAEPAFIEAGNRAAEWLATRAGGYAQSRLFGYRNFLVCDGSTVPANPGVNPSLTIPAMSEYAMSVLPPAITQPF